MIEWRFTKPGGTNVITLTEALQSVIPGVTGVSTHGDLVRVHALDTVDPSDEAQAAAVVAAHDPGVLSPQQQEDVDADSARTDLAAMISSRIVWHEENPATTGNAVQVLQRLQTEWTTYMKYIRRELRR